MYAGFVTFFAILSVLLCICNIYNVLCAVGLMGFIKKALLKENIQGSRFNIYKKIILLSNKVKSANNISEKSKACLKKGRFWFKISWAVSGILSLLIICSIILALVYNTLNIASNSIINVITSMGDDECTCYALCTGNVDDDSKTAYELLFGPTEFNRLCNALNLEPQYKEELQDIHDGKRDVKGEPRGKIEGEYIIKHLNDDAVNIYKEQINSSTQFRPGDHKDRHNMTDEELKSDLIALLSDYKENGRNPQCKVCNILEDVEHTEKCLGGKHWVKGWHWDDIWNSHDSQYTPTLPTLPVGPITGTTVNGAKNSAYGIELDDGWYYWYHQDGGNGCTCTYCGDWSGRKWGFTGSQSNAFGKDGCAVYSLAIGLSNLMDMEITPTEIHRVLGTDLSNPSLFTTASGPFSGTGRGINRGVAMDTLGKTYGLEVTSIQIKDPNSNLDEKIAFIDGVLAKGGYVWSQWVDPLCDWCSNGTAHFMCIRKVVGDNYYCFTSCGGKKSPGGGKSRAIHTMNMPLSKEHVLKSLVSSAGSSKPLYGMVNPNRNQQQGNNTGASTGDFKDLNVQDITITIPNYTGSGGSFIWASDLHMSLDATSSYPTLQQRAQQMTGDANFDFESILNQICNLADSEGVPLILGGDIIDYVSPNNLAAYERATSGFRGDLTYIRADHDTNTNILQSTGAAAVIDSNAVSKANSTSLKGTFNGVKVIDIGGGIKVTAFDQTTADSSTKYSFGDLGSTSIAVYHTPFDYGNGEVANETLKHGHSKYYAWNYSGQYLLYTSGSRSEDIMLRTKNAGAAVSGHVHPSNLVEIKNQLASGGSEYITKPAFTKTVYRVRVAGSGASGSGSGAGGTNVSLSVDAEEVKQKLLNSPYAAKAESLALIYSLVEPRLGANAAIGMMANANHEGSYGVVEHYFSKNHHYGFRLPVSKGDKVTTRQDMEYLRNWTIEDAPAGQKEYNSKGEEIKRGSCGLGSVQWSYDRRIALVDIYLSMSGDTYTDEMLQEGEARVIDLEMTVGEYYYNVVSKAANKHGGTCEAWAEAFMDYYEVGTGMCPLKSRMTQSGSGCRERRRTATDIANILSAN